MIILQKENAIDGHKFKWNGFHGMADASEMGITPGSEPGDLIYDDAIDLGFYVRGQADSGKNMENILLFVFVESIIMTPEDDVIAWKFVSVNYPQEMRITIYND